ncbi:hypothetical protein [Scytonema sp. PCC 10023]|uniref:hypothetical protein n=1 Tax=Scytonema sp. PCC 10023 TaxID=1680591 RepID=UPI0039C6905C
MLPSLKTLLASIVDYAGLFPPAKLSLHQAMANYADYQLTPYSWMLSQFVLPVSRLNEFEALLPTFALKQWSLSMIISKDWEADLERVRCSQREPRLARSPNSKNHISVTSLEFPPLPPTEIKRILPHLPTGVDVFFEIPLSGDIEAYLAVLRDTGAAAKVRTGGITVDAFPSVRELCQCILSFAEAQVSFKATAGLHHPLPGNYRLTYEQDSPVAVMHGFLNVAVLAALVYWQKVTLQEALEVLQESACDNFQFTATAVTWRNYRLEIKELEKVRQKFFRSFGSCSFQEPLDELKKLKLLN